VPTAIDLFAGAGGATQGLRDAGFDVVAAVENDADAAATWRLNQPGAMLERDVRLVSAEQLRTAGGLVSDQRLDLLKACPPCQGFSSLRGDRDPDERRNDLVLDTLRLVEELSPRAVLLENVPGLRRDSRFAKLTAGMRELEYGLVDFIVEASSLGVPQRRRRLVIVAVHKLDGIPSGIDTLVPPARRRPPLTAGAALSALAAQLPAEDPAHVWRRSRGAVAERIRAVPVGGSRFDLPEHLQLACHRRLKTKSGAVNRSATGSYGRVRQDEPAPTMTTRCTTPACGSFIHPTEPRGLSLREAAALQTFPASYRWHGGYDSIERQIGNAVPVWMAQALGEAVARLLDQQDAEIAAIT
jgi:DNA (cytosine-5)-methyltransferase 1